MSISPQVHDVTATTRDSCNCCDHIICCVPFKGRKITHKRQQSVVVVHTADEAIQKNTDSPQSTPPILTRVSASLDLRSLQ
jgi:hypothetical protein